MSNTNDYTSTGYLFFSQRMTARDNPKGIAQAFQEDLKTYFRSNSRALILDPSTHVQALADNTALSLAYMKREDCFWVGFLSDDGQTWQVYRFRFNKATLPPNAPERWGLQKPKKIDEWRDKGYLKEYETFAIRRETPFVTRRKRLPPPSAPASDGTGMRADIDISRLMVPPSGMQVTDMLLTTFSLDGCLLNGLIEQSQILLTFGQTYAHLPEHIQVLADQRHLCADASGNCRRGRCKTCPKTKLVNLLGADSIRRITMLRQEGKPISYFHPKGWILRFQPRITPANPITPATDASLTLFRVVVMSHNLMSGDALEAGVVLEAWSHGTDALQPPPPLQPQNQGLADLFRQHGPDMATQPAWLGDLLRTDFSSAAGAMGVSAYRFLWKDAIATQWREMCQDADEIYVLSPFVRQIDRTGYLPTGRLNKDGQPIPIVLVTRSDDARYLSDADWTSGVGVYYASGQPADQDKEDNPLDGNPPAPSYPEDERPIHAKVLMVNKGGRTLMLIGSANLSANALHGHNAELMLYLEFRTKRVSGNSENSANGAASDEAPSGETILTICGYPLPIRRLDRTQLKPLFDQEYPDYSDDQPPEGSRFPSVDAEAITKEQLFRRLRETAPDEDLDQILREIDSLFTKKTPPPQATAGQENGRTRAASHGASSPLERLLGKFIEMDTVPPWTSVPTLEQDPELTAQRACIARQLQRIHAQESGQSTPATDPKGGQSDE